MQGAVLKTDPQLQKSNPGPRVAIGLVDPCVLYLEATKKGEVPILFACWARSSCEIREAGGATRLKLSEVVIVMGKPIKSLTGWSMRDGKTLWNFSRHPTQELQVRKDASGWFLKGFPNSCYSQCSQDCSGYQGSLRFLEEENDSLLLKLSMGSSNRSQPFVQKILEFAQVDWPSLVNARASLQIAPVFESQPKVRQNQAAGPRGKIRLKQRRKSLLHKIFSTVFKRKKLEKV